MARLPKRYKKFLEDYPEVGQAYEAYGTAVAEAGPLDEKTRSLIKLAISVGGRLEGASKSHAHKALQSGASAEELRHVVILAAPTIGFPGMMQGLCAVNDVIEEFDKS